VLPFTVEASAGPLMISLGAFGGGPAGRNATTAAAHACPDESVAVAEMGPGDVCLRSSTLSLELGAAGTCSCSVNPLPAVNVAAFEVERTPRIKSPPEVVVMVGLARDALVPSAMAGVPSSDDVTATPEYSKIANRSVPPEIVSDTVTVFVPATMLSA
jgi:hypothetical protein